jgi:tetraacyldisaccharide 4'-kinase
LALAAIAQPEVFFAMLRSRGLILDRTLSLPDHYDFNSYSPIGDMGYTLICTEKDAVKLWPIRPDAWAVPLVSTLPDAFWAALNVRIDSLIGATTPSQPLSSRHGHTTT